MDQGRDFLKDHIYSILSLFDPWSLCISISLSMGICRGITIVGRRDGVIFYRMGVIIFYIIFIFFRVYLVDIYRIFSSSIRLDSWVIFSEDGGWSYL
jgi:hypothetical protein